MTRVLPSDQLASLRRGDLVETDVRIVGALGDEKRSHLRRDLGARTLCGKPVKEGASERGTLRAMGARKGCSACAARANPGERRAAAARAAQIVARGVSPL